MNICFQLFVLIIGFLMQSFPKDIPEWNNPGFEGTPGKVANPVFWPSCYPQSTPDMLPGIFDVDTKPAEGNSYVGLITRTNGQKEDIYQELSIPFEKGSYYSFSLQVARSQEYLKHNTPIGLKIWLGTGPCLKSQLIHHEKIIDQSDWRKLNVQFTATARMRYIIFEPCSTPGLLFDYAGNVLLDDLSGVQSCNRS